MAQFLIEDLHQGMNLRDPAAVVSPGETGLSMGCDFSVPGEIRPMHDGLLTDTMDEDIQDAHIVYIDTVKYLFTTHADGLRVNNVLIDATFTGHFKVLDVNDEYVVLANATLNKKWKPGWVTTYDWGLNTPPLPTLTIGAHSTKTIDDFEDLTDWGVTACAKAADTTDFKDGTQSMKLTVAAGATGIAKRAIALDLSNFTTPGDAGSTLFMAFSYYSADLAAVNAIRIKLSCAVDGKFNKDYYQMSVVLGGYVYSTLGPTEIGRIESVTTSPEPQQDIYYDNSTGRWMRQGYDPNSNMWTTYEIESETTNVTTTITQQITIQSKKRATASNSLSWTDLKIPFADFIRIGNTAGRGWDTITAISIEVDAVGTQAIISFDSWEMYGGGELWGYYQVAVAYQNELGNYGPFTKFTDPIYLEAQQLEIDGLTPDTDLQTTQRRIAIIGGSITQPMIIYLENNLDTSLTYNQIDTALTEIETKFNNHKPIVGIVDMQIIQGRIFFVTGNNNVYYSEELFYEAFPLKNYIDMADGERFVQIGNLGNTVAIRGKGREYFLQLTGSTPAYWQPSKGAPEGAVSSRLLIEDWSGAHVWVSKKGFWISGAGYYLPKIDPVIADFSQVFGARAGKMAYVGFTDTDGYDRIMRIDFSLGRSVPHYVKDLAVAAIFADHILGKVYYAYGPNTYEFDADEDVLPTILTIPDQFCKSASLKDFASLDYLLTGGPLTLAISLDGTAIAGTLSLADKTRGVDNPSFPQGTIGSQIGLTLSSTTQDWLLKLPIGIEQVPL